VTRKTPAALTSREVANHKEQGKPHSTERGPSEGRSARLERPQTQTWSSAREKSARNARRRTRSCGGASLWTPGRGIARAAWVKIL
jgi:hypothetical protein